MPNETEMPNTITHFSDFNFHPPINKALQDAKYDIPTPVQAAAILPILSGKDIIACAPTGTGKTAAFILPTLNRLANSSPSRKPRVLILTPTRELADQIRNAADKYGKFLKIKIISLVGGMPYGKQLRDLSGADIIIATPGRLLDLLANNRVDLSSIEVLVLDEADRMADMGFIDDVKEISKLTPDTRQTLLFSATMDQRLTRDIGYLLKNPVKIDLSTAIMAPEDIEQKFYLADNYDHKLELFEALLTNESIFKAIVFCATKADVDQLARMLREEDYAAVALHGDLKQPVRNRVLEQLRRGKVQILVATDVASRGINVSDISHVINFDFPRTPEDYVHRIGRTGRGGKSGIAISLLYANDGSQVKRLEKYTGQRINLLTIEGLEPKKRLQSTAEPNRRHKKRPMPKYQEKSYKKASYANTSAATKSKPYVRKSPVSTQKKSRLKRKDY